MYFLIRYDKETGKLEGLTPFSSGMGNVASLARLEQEIALLEAGVEREVVLLEAESEVDLRKTHSRYFQDVEGMASR